MITRELVGERGLRLSHVGTFYWYSVTEIRTWMSDYTSGLLWQDKLDSTTFDIFICYLKTLGYYITKLFYQFLRQH